MARERGYTGGPDYFRHVVSRFRPRPPAEAYQRLRTLPGEQSQVDWAHFGKLTVGNILRDPASRHRFRRGGNYPETWGARPKNFLLLGQPVANSSLWIAKAVSAMVATQSKHLDRARERAAAASLRRRVLEALVGQLESFVALAISEPSQSGPRSLKALNALFGALIADWPGEMQHYLIEHFLEFFRSSREEALSHAFRMPSEGLAATLRAILVQQASQASELATRAEHILGSLEELAHADSGDLDIVWRAAPPEPVQFAVYAPAEVSFGTPFALDLWAFQENQRETVESLASRLRELPVSPPVAAAIPEGSVLGVFVQSKGLDVADARRVLVWRGQAKVESFTCAVRAESGARVSGSVFITLGGLLIARADFAFAIAATSAPSLKQVQYHVERPTAAFVSYASANRIEVLCCLQGVQKVAPDLDIFIDVDRLRSGDDWDSKLTAFISTSDVMYLFWSRHAAASEWVRREWTLGLSQKGVGFIDPFVLESPELVPPPPELAALHFNDRYLLLRLAQQFIEQEKGMP
jgi:hypothetical protein